MASSSLAQKSAAEFIGTFWLVFAGCGAAVLEATYPKTGIGFLGVGLAFGLALLSVAYAIGHISGCHLNPAVSLGLAVGKRFGWSQVPAYVIAQLLGAIAGAAVLYVIASGNPDFSLSNGFACNGYGDHSPGGYSLRAGFISEAVLTFMFLVIIMGASHDRTPAGFAPIPVGLGLTCIHFVGIPITNLSVNPARSTATAIFVGGWAIHQLWLFWVAPILGGLLGGIFYRCLTYEHAAVETA
jgi:aquaporin Z